VAVETFTLDSLSDIEGGKVRLAFDRLLKRCADDCYDRPGDGAARTVTLKLEIKPVLSPEGGCERVNVQVFAESGVPKLRSRVFDMGLTPSGRLLFNADSPDSVDQGTLLPDASEGD
jgi:hypothetical protein